MEKQNKKAKSFLKQMISALKQIDKKIDERVNFFIDQIENEYQ